MKLGSKVFDSRTREHGTFCGWTGLGHARAMVKRDGRIKYVGRKFLKRFNVGLWTR